MIRCTVCSANHPPNTAFCDECGASLALGVDGGQRGGEPPTATQTADATLPVRLVSADGLHELSGELNSSLLIGRLDRSVGAFPDVDLTAIGGMELGISRRHARLTRTAEGVQIEDLNSLNGTYLRGHRLPPHEPRTVASGDELRFGKAVLVIRF